MTATEVRSERVGATLSQELDRVYRAVAALSQSPPWPTACDRDSGSSPEDLAGGMALERLVHLFGLSPFERDLLVLCAGVELESRFSAACAAAHAAERTFAQNDPRMPWPTFGVALAALPNSHWSALNPDRPLRHWLLIELESGALVRSAVRINERILHYLLGAECADERVDSLIHPLRSTGSAIPGSQRVCAERAVDYWSTEAGARQPVLLAGRRASDRRRVGVEIGRMLNRSCSLLPMSDIPVNAAERERLARLWNREAALTGMILAVDASEAEPQDLGRIAAFLDRLVAPVVVEVYEGGAAERLEGFRIRIPNLDASGRKAIWIENLGASAAALDSSLDRVAEYFNLDDVSIRQAASLLQSTPISADTAPQIWRTCRTLSRRTLDGLAQRIETKAAWEDVVLPEQQASTLKQIVAHVRQRAQVYGKWGFASHYSRGLGVTALFSGASGTGKTMAAEAIASELDLDLYQIDLAGVVSKYIGETEKNLRRIFDAAEDGGAVLLFDEADALFGKRGEVSDSRDRYANLEVSYLLQRMEAYRGLAILTTNMKQAMDSAFLRRLRFIVQFPFPGPEERRRIWERVFPAQTPVGQLNYARIAQLNIAGGLIRNIATHAAFLASDECAEIGMNHILSAARVEYAKLDRPLTPAECGGWK